VGQRIDARAKEALLTRHYKPPSTRSRPICEKDFQSFDLILAMDESNLRALARQCPPVYQAKLGLFLSFAPQCGATEVPDPYYGNMAGFVRVIDLCEAATRALLAMELAGRCVGVGEKRIG
jgi:protein-tyrosine phosphatase